MTRHPQRPRAFAGQAGKCPDFCPYYSPAPEQLGRLGIHITTARTSGMVMADISVETRITPATSSGRLSYMRA